MSRSWMGTGPTRNQPRPVLVTADTSGKSPEVVLPSFTFLRHGSVILPYGTNTIDGIPESARMCFRDVVVLSGDATTGWNTSSVRRHVMKSQLKDVRAIRVTDLQLDPDNPRFDRRRSQREAISTFALKLGEKLYNLAESMIEKGCCPFELPIVTPTDEKKRTFVVLEGNRRIAALKLLASPSLVKSIKLSARLTKKYLELCEAAGSLPKAISCAVMPREDASHWIQIRHTGENKGVGVVTWDGAAAHRFRGNSPALQAVDIVAENDLLDKATIEKLSSIPITNIERLLGTPDARELLGVEVKARKLSLKAPEDVALARLAEVVSDVTHGIKKVTDLDTKEQRIAYAGEVVARCPTGTKKSRAAASGTGTGAAQASTRSGSSGGRKVNLERKSLIPSRLKMHIPEVRINKIYDELQKLPAERFVNSCAVLMRVFVEMSVECYAKKHRISLFKQTGKTKGAKGKNDAKEMTLRGKLLAVVEYMKAKKVADKHELQGMVALINDRNSFMSVEGWHGYVHNRHFNPIPSVLKTNWDNIQPFMMKIWETPKKRR